LRGNKRLLDPIPPRPVQAGYYVASVFTAISADTRFSCDFGMPWVVELSAYLMSGVSIVVHRKLDYPDFFEDGVN